MASTEDVLASVSLSDAVEEGTGPIGQRRARTNVSGRGGHDRPERVRFDFHRDRRRLATVTTGTELHAVMLTQPVFRPFAMDHPRVLWALLEPLVAQFREADSRMI